MEIKKKARVGTQQTSKSTKTDFKTETLTRDKEGCYIKIKGWNQQGYIAVMFAQTQEFLNT